MACVNQLTVFSDDALFADRQGECWRMVTGLLSEFSLLFPLSLFHIGTEADEVGEGCFHCQPFQKMEYASNADARPNLTFFAFR